MNILALETSTRSASVAVSMGGRIAEVVEMSEPRQTASWLNEAVDAALRKCDLRCRDIELLGITAGPGSFTGLRIAVTFAKLFCYSTSADLIALDTLDVIAHQSAQTGLPKSPLHVIIDALRQELFHARFQVTLDGRVQRETATAILKQADFLNQIESTCTVGGPAAAALRPLLPGLVTVLDDAVAFPIAVAVAELALTRHQQGQRDDIWKLVPRYYRRSYAEAGEKG